MALRVMKLAGTAHLPRRGSAEAAGYDLAACLRDASGAPRGGASQDGTLTLAPNARGLIPTGLAFTVPEGTYGRIGPRSGLALKHGIDTLAGIVDRDYTNEVGVVLINLGQAPFVIDHGMRVAQLVIEQICSPDVIEVTHLDETARGLGGFGSTGLGPEGAAR